MSVDKVILRAFLSTLAAIVVLFAFMIAVLIGFYPSTMMEITYDLGMESSSIKYAERAYAWSKNEYYMAYAMDVAIEADDYQNVVACGEKLISDENFAAYCASRTEKLPETVAMTYDQYVYGQVCVAEYAQGKKEGAVERAIMLSFKDGAFPLNNAVVAVLYAAKSAQDTDTVSMIREKMNQQQMDVLSDADKAYFEDVLALAS